jgi:hypothetical protein
MSLGEPAGEALPAGAAALGEEAVVGEVSLLVELLHPARSSSAPAAAT